MEINNKVVFRAIFDNGVILEWEKPNFYSNVFKSFKLWGSAEEATGILFCGNKPIRATGRNQEEFFKVCKLAMGKTIGGNIL